VSERRVEERPEVVIAGGGIAGLEALIALCDLAGDRVSLALVAPDPDFSYKPLTVEEPFTFQPAERHALGPVAEEFGARFIQQAIVEVRPQHHTVELADGSKLGYDAAVICVGGRQRPAYRDAITFRASGEDLEIDRVLRESAGEEPGRIAFVVPPGISWPLPLYELALMTARSVRGMGIDDVRLQIVSPEATPLALFGAQASAAVADLLEHARIDFHGGAHVRAGENGRLELLPGGETLDAERIVALPTIEGPQLAGVPTDEHGFIPIDEDGRVRGLSDVYAAGDGTTYPVKQGGIACQLADAIAERLAAAAGADVDPQPFAPVLRGRLLTGHGAHYLEHPLHSEPGTDPAPELRLWSAAHKVEGRYLSPWLAELDGTVPEPVAEPVPPAEEHVEIEVRLPASYDRRDALQLDPYSPLR
jgi:sulfide:quinone oxidoreductase